MPDFSPVIADAYFEILGREPDPDGLRFYDARMNSGLSEASLREILLRSEEYRSKHDGFRPLVVDGAFNFVWRGYTSFGLFGRSIEERIAWVERGVSNGITVFRVFSDTSFWPSDPLLDRVPKHRAVDASGLHPSAAHLDLVRETILRAFSPFGAVMEYVILVTQFEGEGGPLFRRFPETERYVREVVAALSDLPNIVFELGNEVEAHGKGWGPARVNRNLREIRSLWPHLIISCSRGVGPDPEYGDYVYPEASWANIHYPRQDFPELSFGWPRFAGPVVDDEPEFFPETDVDAYVTHQRLVIEQDGFLTVHSETGFVTDPEDEADMALLIALDSSFPSPP
ncbi:MAG TPA: hypothetical protein VLK65_17580 [Vicinamibacteria bacterium]|nr:hypothetical protein [Vicinamibacteria bacterium]